MRSRAHLVGAVATVLLTAASVAALAASRTPAFTTSPGMSRVGAATCAAPPSLPGSQVRVVLGDMAGGSMMGAGPLMGGGPMTLSTNAGSVSAGAVSLIAVNHGSRVHELVVLPLTGSAAAGTRSIGPDGTVSETSSLGEASGTCAAGSGDGISPGATSWVTLNLEPGRYELFVQPAQAIRHCATS